MAKNQPIEKYVAAVRLNGGLRTNLPFTYSGITTGAVQSLPSAATITLSPTSTLIQHTPTQSETINFAAPVGAGFEIFFEVITSGASSYTLTFGTNTKTTGTLATGTTTGKYFIVAFVSDGTNWVETGRTTAM